jgi:DNA-binding transcriptional LysR family regulator
MGRAMTHFFTTPGISTRSSNLQCPPAATALTLRLSGFVTQISDLIAVVPYRLAAQAECLAIFEVPVTVPGFTKTLVWHERSHRAPGHCWARERLVGTCAAPDKNGKNR